MLRGGHFLRLCALAVATATAVGSLHLTLPPATAAVVGAAHADGAIDELLAPWLNSATRQSRPAYARVVREQIVGVMGEVGAASVLAEFSSAVHTAKLEAMAQLAGRVRLVGGPIDDPMKWADVERSSAPVLGAAVQHLVARVREAESRLLATLEEELAVRRDGDTSRRLAAIEFRLLLASFASQPDERCCDLLARPLDLFAFADECGGCGGAVRDLLALAVRMIDEEPSDVEVTKNPLAVAIRDALVRWREAMLPVFVEWRELHARMLVATVRQAVDPTDRSVARERRSMRVLSARANRHVEETMLEIARVIEGNEDHVGTWAEAATKLLLAYRRVAYPTEFHDSGADLVMRYVEWASRDVHIEAVRAAYSEYGRRREAAQRRQVAEIWRAVQRGETPLSPSDFPELATTFMERWRAADESHRTAETAFINTVRLTVPTTHRDAITRLAPTFPTR